MSERAQELAVEKMMQLPEKDQRFLLGFVAGMVSRQERQERQERAGEKDEGSINARRNK